MGALLVNIVTTIFLFHMEYGLERCCVIIPFICAHFLLQNKTFILGLCVLTSKTNTAKCWALLGIVIWPLNIQIPQKRCYNLITSSRR